MMGSKRRASRDMARMDGKHFSLDSVLTVLSFLILVVVVVIPMVMIVYNTFFYEGKFDTSLFTQIILDPGNVAAMWNTIKIALLVTLFGTIVGLFFAWLLGRSDIPFKGLMRSMFTIPYMFPPFFGAMAWELLLSPRSGYLNKWLMATFHLSQAPFNINSIGGIIFVECSYYFPFVFMQVVSALERMDPTLEESARIAGAKQWYVIRRITMPLVLPATSAGALLILTSSLSHFGVPSILGFSKKIYTLPTRIYQLISRASGSFQGIREGAALSILPQAVAYNLDKGEVLLDDSATPIRPASISVFEETGVTRRDYIQQWFDSHPRATAAQRQEFLSGRRNVHFFFNRITDEKLAMDANLYNSLMVRLLVGNPQDPAISPYFKLVYDNVFCRIYEVL